MTQSISVVYVPVDVSTYGLTGRPYHMAIVYDKGDGTAPKVIQARPLVEWSGTEAQKNEVPREINELYNPFSAHHRPGWAVLRQELGMNVTNLNEAPTDATLFGGTS